MKLFKNIIVQFTFFTFFVVFAISVSLGVILSRSMTNQALTQHIDIYPKLGFWQVPDMSHGGFDPKIAP